MSDFLDRVLASSFGAESASVVQPRPLARYEPANADWLTEASTEPELASPPSTILLPRQERSGPPAQPLPVSPSDPVREMLVVRETLTVRAPLFNRPAEPVPGDDSAAKGDLMARPGPVEIAPAERDPTDQGAPALERIEVIQPREPAPVIVRVEKIEPAPALPVPAPLSPSREEGRRKPVEKNLPTVHVTIGRIEVNKPPAPPRQPSPRHAASPARPVRSLDDYLRHRNGGQR